MFVVRSDEPFYNAPEVSRAVDENKIEILKVLPAKIRAMDTGDPEFYPVIDKVQVPDVQVPGYIFLVYKVYLLDGSSFMAVPDLPGTFIKDVPMPVWIAAQ